MVLLCDTITVIFVHYSISIFPVLKYLYNLFFCLFLINDMSMLVCATDRCIVSHLLHDILGFC